MEQNEAVMALKSLGILKSLMALKALVEILSADAEKYSEEIDSLSQVIKTLEKLK